MEPAPPTRILTRPRPRSAASGWLRPSAIVLSLCMLMAITASLNAATLRTTAVVSIVPAIEVTLDLHGHDGSPGWSIAGAPEQQVHVTLGWSTPAGAPRQELCTISLQTDADGRFEETRGIAGRPTTLDLLDHAAHAPASDTSLVMTLVICRE